MRTEKIRGNIFVANLPIGLTDEQLAELFDPYGMVLRAYLARDPATGQTRGHGLVQLAPDRVIDTAIAATNGIRLERRRIEVRRADPEMSLVPATPPRPQFERPRSIPREAVVIERPLGRARAASGLAPARLTLTGQESWR